MTEIEHVEEMEWVLSNEALRKVLPSQATWIKVEEEDEAFHEIQAYDAELENLGWVPQLNYPDYWNHPEFLGVSLKMYDMAHLLAKDEAGNRQFTDDSMVLMSRGYEEAIPDLLGCCEFGVLMTTMDGISAKDLLAQGVPENVEELRNLLIDYIATMIGSGWVPSVVLTENIFIREDGTLGFIEFSNYRREHLNTEEELVAAVTAACEDWRLMVSLARTKEILQHQ